MDKKNYQLIPIDKLEMNSGQLEGLPKTPRYIKDERYDALKKSISDTPGLLRPGLHRLGLFHARRVKNAAV